MPDDVDTVPPHLKLVTEHRGGASDELDISSRLQAIPDPRAPRIVYLRIQGYSWKEVHAALRCDEKTTWTIRRKYDLDSMVMQLAAESVAEGLLGYRGLYASAMRVTRDLMLNEDERGSTRLQAANAIRQAVERTAEISVQAAGVQGAERLARALENVATEDLESIVESGAPDGEPRPGRGSEG